MLAPVFLIAVGIAGFFAYRELSIPKSPSGALIPAAAGIDTALPLKLSVAEKQNQLDVTWDRNAPAILQARRGVLAISDGANKRDLELSGAQLRTGRVLYSRLSADVGLRLEVFGEGPEPVTPPPAPEPAPIASDPPPVPRQKPVPLRPGPRVPQRVAPAGTPPKNGATQPEGSPPEVELQRPPRRK